MRTAQNGGNEDEDHTNKDEHASGKRKFVEFGAKAVSLFFLREANETKWISDDDRQ